MEVTIKLNDLNKVKMILHAEDYFCVLFDIQQYIHRKLKDENFNTAEEELRYISDHIKANCFLEDVE